MPGLLVKVADVKQDTDALVQKAAEIEPVPAVSESKAHGIGEGENRDAPQKGLDILRALTLVPEVIAVVEELPGRGMGTAGQQLLAILPVGQKAGACGYGEAVFGEEEYGVALRYLPPEGLELLRR